MKTPYSMNDMAEEVLKECGKSLSASEIWREACLRGLDKKLSSVGKTPVSTLSVALSRDAFQSKNPRFKQCSTERPFKYQLLNNK